MVTSPGLTPGVANFPPTAAFGGIPSEPKRRDDSRRVHQKSAPANPAFYKRRGSVFFVLFKNKKSPIKQRSERIDWKETEIFSVGFRLLRGRECFEPGF